jgi:hypothetical protein
MEGRATSFNEARRNKKGRKGVIQAEETQQKTKEKPNCDRNYMSMSILREVKD